MAMALMNAGLVSNANVQPEPDQRFKHAPAVMSETFDMLKCNVNKYMFISTKDVVEALEKNGLKAIGAAQANTRTPYRRAYVKHLLTFEMTDVTVNIEGVKPQVMLLNSHDGTTSYQLFLGLYNTTTRMTAVVGANTFDVQRVMHKGNKSVDEIIFKAKNCIDGFADVLKTIDQMKAVELSIEQQVEFAEQAIYARYADLTVDPVQVLKPLNEYDTEQNLWAVFNRVRTWVVDPASLQQYVTARPVNLNNRKITTIRNISKRVKLNRAIWDLTANYL